MDYELWAVEPLPGKEVEFRNTFGRTMILASEKPSLEQDSDTGFWFWWIEADELLNIRSNPAICDGAVGCGKEWVSVYPVALPVTLFRTLPTVTVKPGKTSAHASPARAKARGEIRICEHCGKRYEAKREWSRFCSTNCRVANDRKMKRNQV